MGTADGERIAPVTWLFSDKPQQPEAETERLSPSVVSPVIVGPSFREKEPRSDQGRFDPINNVSMHALARRGMSSREMRAYLTGREFEPLAVDAEIERLERVGLLDDGQLAETLVRTLRERKGLGRAALTAELRRRHLEADAIEGALGSLDDDELERAVEIAVRRAPQLRSLDGATAKRRLGAFLMRKGYSGSVVSAAVARALESSGPVFR